MGEVRFPGGGGEGLSFDYKYRLCRIYEGWLTGKAKLILAKIRPYEIGRPPYLGVTPIPHGVQVAQLEALHLPQVDLGHRSDQVTKR